MQKKKLTINGTKYEATLSGGIMRIKTERTARGQLMDSVSYNGNEWTGSLPANVKAEFEKWFNNHKK